MKTENTPSPKGDEPTLHCLDAHVPDMESAITLGQGLPAKRNGIVCHYRYVPTLRVGETYTHPSGKYVVNATPDYVAELDANCQKMAAKGFEPPIVLDHKMGDAEKTIGYVKGSRIKDGWFWTLAQYIGDKALDIACINKTSPGITPSMRDGSRNVYAPGLRNLSVTNTTPKDAATFLSMPGARMEHSAATNIPVVNNQPEMEPVTALSADDHGPIYCFSAAQNEPPATPAEVIPMADKTALTKVHRAAMCKEMDMSPDDMSMDDDAVVAKHVEHVGKLRRDHTKLNADNGQLRGMMNMSMDDVLSDEGKEFFPNLHKDISGLRDVATESATKVSQLESEVKNLSHDEQDPELFRGFHELKTEAINLRLREGRISAMQADKLKKNMVNSAGEPNVFMLAMDEEIKRRPIDLILELLDTNEVGSNGPGNSNDVRTLSHEHPGNVNISADATQAEKDAAANKVDPVAYAEECKRLGLTPKPAAA